MKYLNLVITVLFLVGSTSLLAQGPGDEISLTPESITDGDIYALVIGISKYKHIDSLHYAHRDATIFADYLQSDAGGNVDTTNIRLLTNEQATIANIYMAKQWLVESAKEGDLVFFYFAGHGDVESSLYKLGFLLAYDTPKKNYFNNAVRIEDINIMANTLSITNKAKVILITDACKAGKLAGSDNRGNQLVGDQLSTVISNEVRIASCAADELSEEGDFWGGGRGAFSYHLINGLKGMADEPGEEDGIINLFELEDYLEKNVMKDVFKLKKTDQTPVVLGKKTTKLAIVDEDVLSEVIAQQNQNQDGGTVTAVSRSVTSRPSPADLYFSYISKNEIDSSTVQELASHPKWDLNSKIVELFPWKDSAHAEVSRYLDDLANNPASSLDFNRRIAAVLHDQAQDAINAYLAADADELNRRQYYNSQPQDFDNLADKLDFARTLVDTSNYLYQIMESKSYYFRGIADRLLYTQHSPEKELLAQATRYQLKALALDDRASYIHNEIGIIHRLNQNLFGAETAWKKAIELTPEWALPYSNLANLYHKKQDYKLGKEYAEKAIAREDSYFMAHIMLARNTSNIGDYLTSEEHLRKSIALNERHYLGYESLGYLYTNTLDYDLADYFFLEAEKRKLGIPREVLDLSDSDGDGIMDVLDLANFDSDVIHCSLNPRDFVKGDGTAYCAYAAKMYNQGDYGTAETYFEKTIVLQEDHPTAYRYLAEIAYMDKNWIRAELFADKAGELYGSEDELIAYLNAHPPKKAYEGCDIEELVMSTLYSQKDVQYLHAYLLQQLGRYDPAERLYRKMLEDDAYDLNLYLHLINLHERQDQYEQTENVIHDLQEIAESRAEAELYAFYGRMLNREIETTSYHYKSGLLCYYGMDLWHMSAESGGEPEGTFDEVAIPMMITTDEVIKKGPYDHKLAGDNTTLGWSPPILYYTAKAHDHFATIEEIAPDRMRADVLQKLGDIYLYRYKNDDTANRYFAKASALYVDHGDLRDHLIDYYVPRYLLNSAYDQLTQLHERDQLRYENLAMLADFATKKGDHQLASKSISSAKATQPIRDTGLEKSAILQLLLSDQVNEAISKVKEAITAGDDDASMHYTLARLYSLDGKNKKALKEIRNAIGSGFEATWVLDYDPTLGETRNRSDYESVRKLLPVINVESYKLPENARDR